MTAARAGSRPPLVWRLASLVKIEHTIFALPFAYTGALLATSSGENATARELIWIAVAMVGARSLAMALNRLIDREIDARNPRTAGRELPSGRLSVAQVWIFCAFSLVSMVVAAYQLAPIVRYLWSIPVAAFVVYPYLKRVTWLCHLWLGATIGLAPLGAWLAVGAPVALAPVALWLGVACWVAGFDVFYSLFDLEIDRSQGLKSLAARFGVVWSFRAARLLHVVTVGALAAAGALGGAGPFWALGVAAAALLLLYEHLIVSPRNLTRLGSAFFAVNSVIGAVFLAFAIADAAA